MPGGVVVEVDVPGRPAVIVEQLEGAAFVADPPDGPGCGGHDLGHLWRQDVVPLVGVVAAWIAEVVVGDTTADEREVHLVRLALGEGGARRQGGEEDTHHKRQHNSTHRLRLPPGAPSASLNATRADFSVGSQNDARPRNLPPPAIYRNREHRRRARSVGSDALPLRRLEPWVRSI